MHLFFYDDTVSFVWAFTAPHDVLFLFNSQDWLTNSSKITPYFISGAPYYEKRHVSKADPTAINFSNKEGSPCTWHREPDRSSQRGTGPRRWIPKTR